MKSILLRLLALVLAGFTLSAGAVVIDFTGGTVTRLDTTTETTNNVANWDNVDYYEENGFRLDFIPNAGSAGFATQVGNYYGAGNDVIHAHWATGNFGGITAIEITKIGGGTFDLNYFILTSNTDTGGSIASGFEQAWIEGFVANVSTGAPVLLPPEDWASPQRRSSWAPRLIRWIWSASSSRTQWTASAWMSFSSTSPRRLSRYLRPSGCLVPLSA